MPFRNNDRTPSIKRDLDEHLSACVRAMGELREAWVAAPTDADRGEIAYIEEQIRDHLRERIPELGDEETEATA